MSRAPRPAVPAEPQEVAEDAAAVAEPLVDAVNSPEPDAGTEEGAAAAPEDVTASTLVVSPQEAAEESWRRNNPDATTE